MKDLMNFSTSKIRDILLRHARSENLLRCLQCNSTVPLRASRFRTILDFLLLYLIGIYELLRQWLFASKTDHNHITQLLKDIETHQPIILISGVTSGIGSELLRHFVGTSAHVIALGYHPRPVFNRKYTMLSIDFESAESTLTIASELIAALQSKPPDRDVIFVHCAAVYNPTKGKASNPVERTLLINTFLPMAFIEAISSVLSGVICIGSSSQGVSPNLGQCCVLTAAQSPYGAYPFSKMLSLVHMIDWGLRTSKPCIVIHPGVVATNLYKSELGLIGAILRLSVSCFAWDVQTSALRILQVLETSRFFERTRSQAAQQVFHRPLRPDNIFWDSVTIKPSSLPRQLRECHPCRLSSHMLQVMENSFFEQALNSQWSKESARAMHLDT